MRPWFAIAAAIAVVASHDATASTALSKPFDLATFKTTAAYAELLEAIKRDDPSVPGVSVSSAELDALLARIDVEARAIKWVRKFASPVSRRKQRKRVRSVMHVLLSKSRVEQGARFAQKHKATLERVSTEYAVTVADLLAMMNAESRFGTVQGTFVVASVFLANLAYIDAAEAEAHASGEYQLQGALTRKRNLKRVAKRRKYSATNLATLLRYGKARRLDPLSFTGSWAGAIGITQFMPASLQWAKDGDKDGTIDLSTVPDAIESTANYLVEHGYKEGVLEARRRAFHAYNPNREYVNAIVAYAERFEERSQPKK